MTKIPFNWKAFWMLLAGSIVGLVGVVPTAWPFRMKPRLRAAAQANMPLWTLVTLQLAPQVILFGVAIWVGLSFARSVGLGLPFLEARLRGQAIWGNSAAFCLSASFWA